MTMPDPILDEIARVRRELIVRHGGLDGYLEYVRKIDRAHQARRRKKAAKARAKRAKTAK
jgi:hypothetical protein